MLPTFSSTVTMTVRLVRARSRRCLACGKVAELHQPDAHNPDRLLACCEHCGAWAQVVRLPDRTYALELPLPDGPAMLDPPTSRPV